VWGVWGWGVMMLGDAMTPFFGWELYILCLCSYYSLNLFRFPTPFSRKPFSKLNSCLPLFFFGLVVFTFFETKKTFELAVFELPAFKITPSYLLFDTWHFFVFLASLTSGFLRIQTANTHTLSYTEALNVILTLNIFISSSPWLSTWPCWTAATWSSSWTRNATAKIFLTKLPNISTW